MEIVYYDRAEFEREFSSESFVLKNMKPVPAGTSIFSMSDTSQNRKWKSFADKYDIHFIFDGAIPEVDFYAVPQFHIMATDSNGGLIGIIGGKDSLNTHLPIGYISPNRECFLVSSSAARATAGEMRPPFFRYSRVSNRAMRRIWGFSCSRTAPISWADRP